MSLSKKKEIDIKIKYLNTPWITKKNKKIFQTYRASLLKIWKIDQMKMKKLAKHIKTYSRGLEKIRRNIIIKIKSNYLEMIYEIHKK